MERVASWLVQRCRCIGRSPVPLSRGWPLSCWSVDVASGRVTMSPEILALHGLGNDTRLTLNECLSFYGQEDKAKIQALFAACVNEGIPYDEELQVLDTSGQAFWVRALGEPVFDDAGEVTRVLQLNRDDGLWTRGLATSCIPSTPEPGEGD